MSALLQATPIRKMTMRTLFQLCADSACNKQICSRIQLSWAMVQHDRLTLTSVYVCAVGFSPSCMPFQISSEARAGSVNSALQDVGGVA